MDSPYQICGEAENACRYALEALHLCGMWSSSHALGEIASRKVIRSYIVVPISIPYPNPLNLPNFPKTLRQSCPNLTRSEDQISFQLLISCCVCQL